MINNDLSSQLARYYNQQNQKTESAGQSSSRASEAFQRLKSRQNTIQGKPAKTDKTGQTDTADKTDAKTAATEEQNLSPMERRKKELAAIMDRLNREESERYPGRNKNKTTTPVQTGDTNQAATTTNDIDNANALGFLNDLPLFNEFKAGLTDAFKMLDGASAGSISAQYELNYSAMQYIANDAGEFEYKETNVSIKLDLNYIKAASGGKTGKEIADAIGNAKDFGSLVENLKNIGQNDMAAAKQSFNPQDMMTSLQDYFSPENTAGRIVDFAAALFPGGDRAEFGEKMRKAIQKGFDQAQGILGKVPKSVQDGIDKTHELTMKGLDDFIANGRSPQKEQQGVYNSLEQFSFNFQMSVSQKTVSVSNYDARGAAQQSNTTTPSALDTQA